MEKSKEKEEELRAEVDRIQSEIKILQKTNEDSATISEKLSREVRLMVQTDFFILYFTLSPARSSKWKTK